MAALKIILTDDGFVPKWYNRMKAEHLTHDWTRIAFKSIEGYYKEFKKLPSSSALFLIAQQFIMHNDPTWDIMHHIEEIINYTPQDIEFTKAVMLDHLKKHDYHQFLVDAAMAIQQDNYLEVERMIRELVTIHTDVEMSPEFLAGGSAVLQRVAREKISTKAMQSRWPTLNANNGGGIEAEALTVFMGPSGSGKSTLLVNAGAHALMNGLTVYHFTFELSKEKTEARYDVCLTGINHATRLSNPEQVQNWLDNRRAGSNAATRMGDLHVIQLPTGQCKVNDVVGLIKQHYLISGKKPDMVILDYLTIMMPNDPDVVDLKSPYATYKKIAEEARGAAMDLKIPFLTAVQSNRGSLEKETIKKQDIADSFGVIHVADLVLTINQTEMDKQANAMRLYVTKSRNFMDSYSIVCTVDYSTLRVDENSATTGVYNQKVETKKAEPTQYKKSATGEAVPVYDPASADAGLFDVLGSLEGFGTGQRLRTLKTATNFPDLIARTEPTLPPPPK